MILVLCEQFYFDVSLKGSSYSHKEMYDYPDFSAVLTCFFIGLRVFFACIFVKAAKLKREWKLRNLHSDTYMKKAERTVNP